MFDKVETERMVGFRFKAAHFEDLNRLHKDKEVGKTMGGVWSDDLVLRRLQIYCDHWDKHRFGMWMFYHKESGDFIGRGGLAKKEIDGIDETEVAFAVLSKYWKQGYGGEIGHQGIEIGFGELALPSLVAFTLPINIASQTLIQKLGFSYEKDIIAFEFKQKLYRKLNPNMI